MVNIEKEKLAKELRLKKATISTLTARTKNWSVSAMSSPKRKRDSDKEWYNQGTPSKKHRGVLPPTLRLDPQETSSESNFIDDTSSQKLGAEKLPPQLTSPIQEKITCFEKKKGEGPPPKSPKTLRKSK